MPKQYIERVGLMNLKRGQIAVYRVISEIRCNLCHRTINKEEIVVRGAKAIHGGNNKFLCTNCRTIKIDIIENKKITLSYFIVNSEWFDKRNGNSLELIKQIASACGYEHFDETDRFAKLVQYRIMNEKDLPKKDRVNLARKFACLVAEAQGSLKVIRSEIQQTIDANFENRTPSREQAVNTVSDASGANPRRKPLPNVGTGI